MWKFNDMLIHSAVRRTFTGLVECIPEFHSRHPKLGQFGNTLAELLLINNVALEQAQRHKHATLDSVSPHFLKHAVMNVDVETKILSQD